MSDSSATKETKGSSRLKQLTSSNTWTSPFRSGKKKNIVQEFRESNDVTKVHLPQKFTSHPTLEAEKKKALNAQAQPLPDASKSAEATGEDQVESKDVDNEAEAAAEDATAESNVVEPTSAEGEENIEEKVEAINETNHAAAIVAPADVNVDAHETAETVEAVGPSDDNIEQQVAETPIELDVPASTKYEPVQAPNQEVLDSLQDKPNLLNRYQDLNAVAIGSTAKELDDPNKVVDLGGGLKLTQQQLLDIAAKRVAPLIANINDEVAKSREEDRIVSQHELDTKVAKHQSKLRAAFEKHLGKLEKQKAKITKDHEQQLKALASEQSAAIAAHEEFKKTHAKNIETANTDYAEREKKALEQHEVDKETLIKNHEELEATKKQELQSAKDNQVTIGTEIEELKEKKINVGAHNEELDKEFEELTRQLEERENELQGLKDKLYTERLAVDKHEQTKKELNEKLSAADAEVETKKSHKGKLALEVGALATAVGAYAAHLANLRSEKEKVPDLISAAKEKHDTWVQEKKDLAVKVAREHEQQRLEAKEAAATEEYKAQLEEEKRQLEEDRAKHLEEKEKFETEEKQRLADEKRKREEEEALAASNKQKAAEEAAAAKELSDHQKLLEKEQAEAEKHRKEVEEETSRAKKGAAAAAAAGTAVAAGTVGALSAHSSAPRDSLPSLKDVGGSNSGKEHVTATNKGLAEEPVPDHKIDHKLGAFAVGAGTVVAGGAATAATLAEPPKERKSSLRKKFKNLIGKSDSKPEKSVSDDDDLYSLYEEVSDDEYERNKNDPNYLEVESHIADKLLRKNRD